MRLNSSKKRKGLVMQDEEQRQAALRYQLQRRLEKVTPELLSQFMYERGVPVVKCLLCHSNDIGIPQASVFTVGSSVGENHTYVRHTVLNTDGPPLALDRYEYRLICNNCGYTSHIAVYPVLKWLESRGGSSE